MKSLNEYETWSINMGLIQQAAEPVGPHTSLSYVPDLSGIEIPYDTCCGKRSLNTFLSPGNITAVIGDSDAGKGMVCYTIGLSMAGGHDAFGFCAEAPVPVLYLDSETSRAQARIKLTRIHKSLSLPGCQNDNFHHIALQDLGISAQAFDPDLANSMFRKIIEDEIVKTKAKVVFFDNLLTMARGVQSSSPMWDSLLRWFRSVEKKFQSAVVFAHHTGKDGNTLGISNIESSCQNVIILTGRSVLHEENEKSKTLFSDYLKRSGCLFKMLFKKSKGFSNLTMHSEGYFLDYDANNPTEGAGWEKITLNNETPPDANENAVQVLEQEEAKAVCDFSLAKTIFSSETEEEFAAQPASPDYSSLSKDARKVMLELAQVKEDFVRSDVDTLLQCKDSKSQTVLGELLNAHLLDRLGEGKNTSYRIRRD